MTDSKDYKFEFDRLRMYFGDDYIVRSEETEGINFDGKLIYPNDITIHQPTLGQIIDCGEKSFYSMLYTFVGNPTTFRLQLWDMGIDWNKMSDYQLFCMLIKGLDVDKTNILFNDIDFSTFEALSLRKIDKEDEFLVLYSEEYNILISEKTYKNISEYLKLMFNIYPKIEKAKGKTTKKWMIDEEREKREREKEELDNNSTLLPMVSACVNHPGFKYRTDELKQIGIVQFMDSVQRLQIYENTKALNTGMYSGMCDLSKVDKNLFNFMRDIEIK